MLFAGLVALGACREPPSWSVRWRIEPRENVPPELTSTDDDALLNGVECSRVGVSVIDLISIAADFDEPFIVDRRFKPCWASAMRDPDRTFGGPALEPGRYELIARGLRASHEPWTYCFVEGNVEVCPDPFTAPRCEEDDSGAPVCQRGYGSCDCRVIEVSEGETVQIRDFSIDAPPECEDGIDGDEDGLVDDLDPGCRAGRREAIDVVTTQLVLDFTLLSGNEAASCTGVRASRFEVMLDGQLVSSPPCEIGQVGVNLSVSPGMHEVAVRVLAFDGTPLTRTKTYALEAFTGGVLQPQLIDVDFADVDFLDPIRSEAQFTVGYTAVEGMSPRFCAGAPGRLEIAQIAVRILDSAGEPVQPAFIVEAGEDTLVGERLDGTLLPCTSQRIVTDVRRWGAYRVEVEALSPEGDVCFSNLDAPQLIAPGSVVALEVPRVEPVVASCRDCDDAADCGSTYRCENRVCVQ
jgi:hypothetical protein